MIITITNEGTMRPNRIAAQAAITALLFATACGSAATSTAGPTCAPREGTYETTLSELPGGTCGTLSPTNSATFALDAGTVSAPGCTLTRSASADDCTTIETQSCPVDGFPGETWEETATIAWSLDGATGSGMVHVERRQAGDAGGAVCTSDYSETFTRE